MSKTDWGTKHLCQSCGAKYYDLNRTPIVCPKCDTEHNPDAVLRSRRAKPAPAPKAVVAKPKKPAAEPESEAEEAIEELIDDDDDSDDSDDLIEDVSELGEDDDDMADVVVKEEEDDS